MAKFVWCHDPEQPSMKHILMWSPWLQILVLILLIWDIGDQGHRSLKKIIYTVLASFLTGCSLEFLRSDSSLNVYDVQTAAILSPYMNWPLHKRTCATNAPQLNSFLILVRDSFPLLSSQSAKCPATCSTIAMAKYGTAASQPVCDVSNLNTSGMWKT